MKRLVLDKQLIRQNLDLIKQQAGRAAIYAVLTGDGHGAGVTDLAKLLRDGGISRFAVAEPADAVALRRAGLVDEEILFLRSTSSRAELEALADLNVIFSIGSPEAGMAVNALADERSTVVEVHIRVDCGAGYGGFPAGDPDKALLVYLNLPNVAVSGVYTSLDGRSDAAAREQAELFRAVLAAIHAAGFETGTVHASGSPAWMAQGEPALDAVRVGAAFLGRCRRSRGDGLQKVGVCEAALEEINWLPKGHKIGGVTLRRPTRLAVLPVGYQNGLGIERPIERLGPMALLARYRAAKRRFVRIDGQKARIVGPIGAMETVINVTNLKCSVGDLATFDLDPLLAKGLGREYR